MFLYLLIKDEFELKKKNCLFLLKSIFGYRIQFCNLLNDFLLEEIHTGVLFKTVQSSSILEHILLGQAVRHEFQIHGKKVIIFLVYFIISFCLDLFILTVEFAFSFVFFFFSLIYLFVIYLFCFSLFWLYLFLFCFLSIFLFVFQNNGKETWFSCERGAALWRLNLPLVQWLLELMFIMILKIIQSLLLVIVLQLRGFHSLLFTIKYSDSISGFAVFLFVCVS
jgi:hypothetical protein